MYKRNTARFYCTSQGERSLWLDSRAPSSNTSAVSQRDTHLPDREFMTFLNVSVTKWGQCLETGHNLSFFSLLTSPKAIIISYGGTWQFKGKGKVKLSL
jgi:hypothetical protein